MHGRILSGWHCSYLFYPEGIGEQSLAESDDIRFTLRDNARSEFGIESFPKVITGIWTDFLNRKLPYQP